MSLFLLMNTSDRALQLNNADSFHDTGDFAISGLLAPALSSLSSSSLLLIERICWWMHIVGIFAFLNYLPWSKHLHILLAFPNAYYARLQPAGKMINMPAIQKEVLYAMQPELAPTDAAPPANLTGKLLSPRKIMMDTRDRLEEVGRNINSNKTFTDDGKTLLHNYISVEELRACTTCNACVEECPVSISPLEIILELRRSLIMEESNAPQEWNSMFSNVENNFAPWKFAPDERDKWTQEA